MITGADINLLFEQQIDKSFSAYLDSFKKNRLFKNTIVLAVEKKYLNLATQKEYDELRLLLNVDKVVSVNGHQIFLDGNPITNITISTGPPFFIVITTAFDNSLQIGDMVTVSGINGITATPILNGSIGPVFAGTGTTFAPNQFMVPATAATGAWTGGGIIEPTPGLLDYWHLFSIKSKYKELVKNIFITGTIANSPVGVKVSGRSSLRTGEQVVIENSADAAANGVFYVRVINSTLIELYTDKDLKVPSPTGNGTTVAGGTISRYYYNYCSPYFSDRKADILGQATVRKPGFIVAKRAINLYPENEMCIESTLDYMIRIQDQYFIDVDNSTTDLEAFWPVKLLYHFIDQAAKHYAGPSRDQMLSQDMTVKTVMNP